MDRSFLEVLALHVEHDGTAAMMQKVRSDKTHTFAAPGRGHHDEMRKPVRRGGDVEPLLFRPRGLAEDEPLLGDRLDHLVAPYLPPRLEMRVVIAGEPAAVDPGDPHGHEAKRHRSVNEAHHLQRVRIGLKRGPAPAQEPGLKRIETV